MKKTTVILMLLTVFSQILGFGREITLSYFYGASNITDIYLISLTIPLVIFSFIGTSISTAYIPMFSKIYHDLGEQEGNSYTNNLVNILLLLCTLIVVLVLIFTNSIVKIFASGFSGETLALAVSFTRVSVLGIYFTAIVSIFNGFLQTMGDYFIPVLIGVPMNIIIIVSIFTSKYSNMLVLSIGSVIATASQLLIIIPAMYKRGYRYAFTFQIRDKHIKEMAYIIWPVIIGVSVNQINIIIDRTMASQIVVGGLSALNYASKISGFIQSIFVLSITTVMYPLMSRMVAKNDVSGFKKSLSDAISQINLLIIPITVGSIAFAEPIIRLLFGRGAFDSNSILMTSSALCFYSVGMVGLGLREVFARAFYSIHDTKTPMINASFALVINIILILILSKFMGIAGIALATSISAIICTLLLSISLRKKIGPFGMKNIFNSSAKILFASVIMGLISKFSYAVLLKKLNITISLFLAIIIGIFLYFLLIYFMKIEDAQLIVDGLKSKIGYRNCNANSQ